jgi:hypothetical protein
MPVWDYHPTEKKQRSGGIHKTGRLQKAENGEKISIADKGGDPHSVAPKKG